MKAIDTNRLGLTIYFEPLELGGGICSILDEDYNILVSDIFGHTRAVAIQRARAERRAILPKLN